MSQRRVIRAELNGGDFIWEVLQENLNTANMSQIQETPGQYWEIEM